MIKKEGYIIRQAIDRKSSKKDLEFVPAPIYFPPSNFSSMCSHGSVLF